MTGGGRVRLPQNAALRDTKSAHPVSRDARSKAAKVLHNIDQLPAATKKPVLVGNKPPKPAASTPEIRKPKPLEKPEVTPLQAPKSVAQSDNEKGPSKTFARAAQSRVAGNVRPPPAAPPANGAGDLLAEQRNAKIVTGSVRSPGATVEQKTGVGDEPGLPQHARIPLPRANETRLEGGQERREGAATIPLPMRNFARSKRVVRGPPEVVRRSKVQKKQGPAAGEWGMPDWADSIFED